MSQRYLPYDEAVVPYNADFKDDLLGRKPLGKKLSAYVERLEDSLVIALDGRWGTGKTFFLERWVSVHNTENGGKGRTVYYDAFANDYYADPLVSLLGALLNRIANEDSKKIDYKKIYKLKTSALKLVRPAARIGLSLATFGASEAFNDFGTAVIEALGNEANLALNDLWKRETGRVDAMREFHRSIKAITEGSGESDVIPLIFVVDELDRCRPDFALETLEIIKHFFCVPHVHFVLGVNLEALEHSVRARYGANIDATSYLQKFITFPLEFSEDIGDQSLTPPILHYLKIQGAKMNVSDEHLLEIENQLKLFSASNNISIRDVGKILAAAAILPKKNPDDVHIVFDEIKRKIFTPILTTLIISKVILPRVSKNLLKIPIIEKELKEILGVTEENIAPRNSNGNRNPFYQRELHDLYYIWEFVRQSGDVDLTKNGFSELREIRHNYMYPGTISEIPKIINDEIINDYDL